MPAKGIVLDYRDAQHRGRLFDSPTAGAGAEAKWTGRPRGNNTARFWDTDRQPDLGNRQHNVGGI